MTACKYGNGCVRFGCTFSHPTSRKRDCKFGGSCTRVGCYFLHPKGHASPAARGPSPTPSRAQAARTPRHQGGKPGNKKQITATYAEGGYSEEFRAREFTTRIVAHVAVDASGSMSGGLTNAAISGLEKIVTEALDADDLYGLLTFDTTVKNLHHCMPRGKVDFAKDAQHVRNNAGGCTALWDAILHGVAELKDTQKRQQKQKVKDRADRLLYEQLVITDGEDNSSAASFEAVAQKVAHPGLVDYHFVLVGVAVDDSTAEVMKQLCRPSHARFIRVQSVAHLVKVLAQQSATMVQMRLHIKQNGATKHDVRGVTSKANAGAAVRAMAQHAPGLRSTIASGNMLGQFSRLALG